MTILTTESWNKQQQLLGRVLGDSRGVAQGWLGVILSQCLGWRPKPFFLLGGQDCNQRCWSACQTLDVWETWQDHCFRSYCLHSSKMLSQCRPLHCTIGVQSWQFLWLNGQQHCDWDQSMASCHTITVLPSLPFSSRSMAVWSDIGLQNRNKNLTGGGGERDHETPTDIYLISIYNIYCYIGRERKRQR